MSLKSRHEPQTRRFTFASLETVFSAGRYSSTTLAIASSEGESALFPVYLQRHSRHTRSNDIAPLARGTALNAACACAPRGGVALWPTKHWPAIRRARAHNAMRA